MTWHGWLTALTAMAATLAMALNVAPPDLVLMAALTLLLLTGTVAPEEALAGFASPAVLSVAALFVVARGMEQTGSLDFVSRRGLGQTRRIWAAQLRLMVPAAAMSAFINNTPIVAMLIPVVRNWGRRTGLPVSKLLMPLTFAASLGGACTIIGTSTNLIVAGMAAALPEPILFDLFDLAVLGVPTAIAGILVVVLLSPWLLKAGAGAAHNPSDPREYTVAMRVAPDAPVIGQTIEEAGLRHLPGLFLVEIERDRQVLVAVAPDERLAENDTLIFAGLIESVVDLRKIRGIVPATNQVQKLFRPSDRRCLVEAVVGAQSPLAGESIRETRFRTRFGAAIIAVHRGGERIRQKVGDIVMAPGDTLLLEASPRFVERHRNDGSFALVSEVSESESPRHDRAPLALTVLAAMVALQAFSVLPLLTAALLAAGALLLTGCLTGEEARRAVDLRVLLTIAASFGLGQALRVSGAAAAFADAIVAVAGSWGQAGTLVAIYLSTAVLTNMVTNNAAAALMFPVAVAAAAQTGLPLPPTLLVLMVAASASFATPIGYQTNLMVLGPGGYRFADFARLGVPLQLATGAVTIAVALAYWR